MSNQIKELLKKPNVTLNELLEQDEIANEFKEQKDYIIQFFQEKQFQTLLNYLNIDHNKLTEKKRAFKFPLTACEIFASTTPQVLEFFKKQDKDSLINFLSLFNEFFDSDGQIKKDNVNYTRVGYVQKIVQALILKEPQVFAQQIYNDNKYFKAFLKHSYCVSTVNILNSIILEIQKDEIQQNDQVQDQSNSEWLNKTKKYRIIYFQEILGQALGTSKNHELYQINKNLGQLISKILKATFTEKQDYMKVYFEEYFIEYGENFLEQFFENQNQITGNIFNLGLLYMISNNSQNYFKVENLHETTKKFFEVLYTYCSKDLHQFQMKKATSFNKEVQIPSNKIYKFVNSIDKQVDLYIKHQQYDILKNQKFAKSLFHLYIIHPYNNILHFRLTQILQNIIKTKQEELLDFFFFKNSAFQHILNQVVLDYKIYQENKSEVKSCYFGFIKQLQQDLQQIGYDDKYESVAYESFIQEFIQIEAKKEQSIFKEIDNVSSCQDYEVKYDFSIDEIQQRYKDFLGLAEQKNDVKEQENVEIEEVEVVDNEDIQQEIEVEQEQIKSYELREELMNVMDQEETAYHDLKFWKSGNYYEIEALMNELNQQLILFIIFQFLTIQIKMYINNISNNQYQRF